MKRTLTYILWSLAGFFFLVWAGCIGPALDWQRHAIRKHRFTSGDIVYNHLDSPFDLAKTSNWYYVQFKGSREKELIGQGLPGPRGTFADNDNIQLIADRNQITCIVGPQIFWRKPQHRLLNQWARRYLGDFNDMEARFFLRSFELAYPVSPHVNAVPTSEHDGTGFQAPDVLDYAIRTVNLEQGLLTAGLAKPHPRWPRTLIYSAVLRMTDGECWWAFDLERTKASNPPLSNLPFPSGVIAEVIVVTVPNVRVSETGSESSPAFGRVSAMPGAIVRDRVQFGLENGRTRGMELPLEIAGAGTEKRRLAIELTTAWGDPNPAFAPVYWKLHPLWDVRQRVSLVPEERRWLFAPLDGAWQYLCTSLQTREGMQGSDLFFLRLVRP